MLVEFRNEPLTDFTREENRRAYREALERVAARFGVHYPLIIGGDRVSTPDHIASVNPSQPAQVIGYTARADVALAEQALQAALQAFEGWSRTPVEARARILFKAAALLRRRRHEFSALMTCEVGKNWWEADADTAEAIDFLEFYGRVMLRLNGPQPLTRIPGEDNELYYIPLGVGVVIAPWNFPLAILAGMSSAAVVAGNTVVLKPASSAPVVAAWYVQLMEEAGLPPGVINYLPGAGEAIGDFLVSHSRTRFVSFTGSREVGLRISELAARPAPGQKWIKRVLAEMGGKDAIVVDAGADLEEAATGIVASAFGFQGQKCSACSRAIVHQDVYERVLDRVVELTRALKVGPATDPDTMVGPLIDERAYQKVRGYIEVGKGEGRLVCGGGPAPEAGPGYFLRPTVFSEVPAGARIAQEEIFGPVLAFIRARDFREAIGLANATEYGLTGSVYSRNRENLEYARREFHAGNLYFNRKCTGALVGVHPFGGFNLSGTNAKAGGRDYLLLLTQAKCVSERW